MNKSVFWAAAAAAIVWSAPVLAESPFDGTWKADVKSTQLEEKPIVLQLQGGTYHCKSCTPTPVSVKADGAFHPVKGQPYYDELAVKIVDDRTVRMMSRKAGKLVGETQTEISADGNTATYSWNNIMPDGSSITGKAWRKRVAAAAKGAHPVDGSWLTTGYENVSDNGLTFSFKLVGEEVHMTTPTGESYVARLGGPAVEIKGDDGGTWVKVRRLSDNSLEETALRDGKVIGVATFTAEPDGKALRAVYENKMRGTKMSYVAYRQ